MKNRVVAIATTALAAVLGFGSAFAAGPWYVAKEDANAADALVDGRGTEALPFRTIQAALDNPDREAGDAVIDPQSGRPGDSLTTREVVFEWGDDPLKEPVWVDLMTGWVYEIPAENQIKHSDGITFVRIPAYDSPCFVTERVVLDIL